MRLGSVHVCRRCLVLYPLAIAVAVIAVLADVPSTVTAAALVLLPLPAVVEWWAEHLGRTPHRPTRLVAVTVLLAAGLGAGFARYFDDATDALFWGVVVVYGGACLAVAPGFDVVRSRSSRRRGPSCDSTYGTTPRCAASGGTG